MTVIRKSGVLLLLAAAALAFSTQPASAGHSCSTVAKIARLSDTAYNIGGSGSCNMTVASLTVSCKPIHRHSGWWHSHSGVTFPASSNTNRTPEWAYGPISGTNGDTYKTSCTGTYINPGRIEVVVA
ncbi:MAG: hypothetical protein HYX34_05800 [Actinobacteria bacterium]|nr:hypothetical protein [Actinomycetota bacterium]